MDLATPGTAVQTILLSANEADSITYNKNYNVRVYAANQCGIGYYYATLSFKTKVAPSSPLVAYPPVNDILIAANI